MIFVTGRSKRAIENHFDKSNEIDAELARRAAKRRFWARDLETGGYKIENIGANYLTRVDGHDVTPRAAIGNITNRRYWTFQYSDYIAPGDPRMVSVNAKIDFRFELRGVAGRGGLTARRRRAWPGIPAARCPSAPPPKSARSVARRSRGLAAST
ncbi:hypothetical protein OKW45_007837 [Paraburkholderia sp. WSM4175]